MSAYRIIGEDRPGRWLVTCDHASNRVPDWVAGGDLGIGHGGWFQRFAAFARAKARLDAGADRGAKGAVGAQGFAGGAGQAAKDAGGGHADKSLPVKARVPIKKRTVKGVIIWQIEHHGPMIAEPKARAAGNRAFILGGRRFWGGG